MNKSLGLYIKVLKNHLGKILILVLMITLLIIKSNSGISVYASEQIGIVEVSANLVCDENHNNIYSDQIAFNNSQTDSIDFEDVKVALCYESYIEYIYNIANLRNNSIHAYISVEKTKMSNIKISYEYDGNIYEYDNEIVLLIAGENNEEVKLYVEVEDYDYDAILNGNVNITLSTI